MEEKIKELYIAGKNKEAKELYYKSLDFPFSEEIYMENNPLWIGYLIKNNWFGTIDIKD